MPDKPSILLIYTGGTIGMMEDPETGQLKPFDFNHLSEQVPELKKFDIGLTCISFDNPLDSSNMNPSVWVKMVEVIEKNYKDFDGFVILHGSDTMAYSASALSFMLLNLAKPVIFTGSQLPIGTIRTDGKENLITAIQIAAEQENGQPAVPEVAIYFEYKLYRGNRTHKYNAEHFQAFQSPNYPGLAEAGVHIRYNKGAILPTPDKQLKVYKHTDNSIAILKIFPGISKNVVSAVLSAKGLKAVIIETFGAGNAPTDDWFINALKKALSDGIIILNVTQCNSGSVEQGRYETSAKLKEIGVIGGADITIEAAVAKLMVLLGNYPNGEIKRLLSIPLCGEITVN